MRTKSRSGYLLSKALKLAVTSPASPLFFPFEPSEVSQAQIEAFWVELQGRGQQAMRAEFNSFTIAEFDREFSGSGDIDNDVNEEGGIDKDESRSGARAHRG